ncbi:MAG: Sua5 family C-terminal domain-containing protein, partial [Burkholderiaceae bacterium]
SASLYYLTPTPIVDVDGRTRSSTAPMLWWCALHALGAAVDGTCASGSPEGGACSAPAAALLRRHGGACSVGIESAIVDVSQAKPALLRPGVLTQAQLEQAVGQSLAQPGPQSPQVSGSLASHYAPAARVMVVTEQDLLQACARAAIPEGDAVYASQVVLNACVSPLDKQRLMPASAVACAHVCQRYRRAC